jgi:hypothetical protein
MLNNEITQNEYKNWLEYDYNPFFAFNQNGSPVYLNRAAELVSGYESVKSFYDIAISFAPKHFGYKTTFTEITFGKFHFFAITIGYENENIIGIKLYQTLNHKESSVDKIKSNDKTNIYAIYEIAIRQAKARLPKTTFRNEFDLEIDDFYLPQNDFAKIMRKIFDSFGANSEIILSELKLKAGEFLSINNEKYPLIELKISAADRRKDNDSSIEELANKNHIAATFENNQIIIEIPLIV